MARRSFNAFRNGKVHVCAVMCESCIYRPGSGAYQSPIIEAAVKEGTAVICHKTLDTPENAVCAGFHANHRTPVLHMAEHMGIVVKVQLPKEENL